MSEQAVLKLREVPETLLSKRWEKGYGESASDGEDEEWFWKPVVIDHRHVAARGESRELPSRA